MLKKLVNKVSDALASEDAKEQDPAAREHSLRMATAILMADVAQADSDYSEDEFDLLLRLIQRHFDLSPTEANEIANAAGEQADELVSLHKFTQLLHQNLDETEKARVVALLWKVAYADGRLDKFEDSLVLKISDLLYVNRGKVMQLKHDAAEAAG